MLNRITLMTLVLVAVFVTYGSSASVDPPHINNDTASTTSLGHLNETEWVLTSLNGNNPIKNSTITLAFPYENDISGCTGCNYYGGTYKARGDNIRFTFIGMEEPTCSKPEALRYQEGKYTTNLSLATHYRLSERELEILTAPGDVLIYAPVSKEKTSGFEAVFVVAGLITVTYLLRKRK